MALPYSIQQACDNKKILKTIIGIDNFNIMNSIEKVKAAEISGATYIDIAANIDILLELKACVSLPICVSSICTQELIKSYKAGADMLEIGNFDIFYGKHIALSEKHILSMVRELKYSVPDASICVTIPHIFNINQQITLTQKLCQLGVDMIQTEGIVSKQVSIVDVADIIKLSSSTLGSASILSNVVNTPVIASSGINPLTAPIAISCGAVGVGIGSFLNYFDSSLEISKEIDEIINAMKLNVCSERKTKNYVLEKDLCSLLSKVS
uniref:Uncharacterized protein ycf23 n=1 Tax=Titanophycus setchellii TaxID=940129 RepID=A0A1G4NXY9_9FLOR|nr:Hypothetical protein ycf23 [Titanophycus setchellii]SCW23550.1 Hypothetical protein ycf23 [Titanophycus setchellii]